MRCLSSTFVSILSAWLVCGCGSLFYAQVEEPELCKTISADFPAAPPVGTTSQSVAVDFDLHSELDSFNQSDMTSSLELKSVEFDAGRGVSDFGFVDAAKITVQGTNNASCNLPDLVDYQRDPSATAQPTLTFPGSSTVDLMPCFKSGKVTIQTNFSGRLPTQTWSMNVKACFSGKARVNYLGGK